MIVKGFIFLGRLPSSSASAKAASAASVMFVNTERQNIKKLVVCGKFCIYIHMLHIMQVFIINFVSPPPKKVLDNSQIANEE
jgi:hypothetical protein